MNASRPPASPTGVLCYPRIMNRVTSASLVPGSARAELGEPRWPDFFLVGAIKCATTSLYHYLRQHPEIYMPEVKEPTYFGTDLQSSNFIRDREEYLRLFQTASPGQRVGEASPWYLYSQRAAREIYEVNPKATIFISLRHPVDVMYSAHGQQLRNGNEILGDFEAALQAEPHRQGEGDYPAGVFLKEGLLYRNIVRFAEQVERYFDVFGRRQVHVLLFDDIVRDPRAILKQLFESLGVDPRFEPQLQVFNPGRRVRLRRLQRLVRHPPKPLRAAARTFVPKVWRRLVTPWIQSWNTQVGGWTPLAPEIRSALQEELCGEILRLEEVIDRDLSIWRAPQEL